MADVFGAVLVNYIHQYNADQGVGAMKLLQ
jgi:hypothetical protein